MEDTSKSDSLESKVEKIRRRSLNLKNGSQTKRESASEMSSIIAARLSNRLAPSPANLPFYIKSSTVIANKQTQPKASVDQALRSSPVPVDAEQKKPIEMIISPQPTKQTESNPADAEVPKAHSPSKPFSSGRRHAATSNGARITDEKADVFDFIPLIPDGASSKLENVEDDEDDVVVHRELVQLSSTSLTRDALMLKHSASTMQVLAGRTVVIDNGSFVMRSGFSGAEVPTSVFRTCVSTINDSSGKPKAVPDSALDFLVGKEAIDASAEPFANVRYPYVGGAISNWDEMEAIWDHCFENELHVDTSSAYVFLTECHRPSRIIREITIETMFELFDVEGAFLHAQPVLALYACGLSSGCVVESGEYFTSVFPVCQGYQLASASCKVTLGGSHLTELFLRQLLSKDNASSGTFYRDVLSCQRGLSTLECARYLKEKYCFVRSSGILTGNDPLTSNKQYLLPDGKSISLGEELSRCPERLFHPTIDTHLHFDDEHSTLPILITDSIKKCGVDMHRSLYENIVIAGGNLQFEGMKERLLNELKTLVPKSTSVNIVVPPDGANAIWKGGSILSSMSTFDEQWITRNDYDEIGMNVVHEKCPVYL